MSHLSPFPKVKQLPKLLSSKLIKNSLIVHLFLNSEPLLGKSKEFNNQGLKVNKNLNTIFSFCHQKTMKNRQALHFIRASSFSIIFLELFFKTVYPTRFVKNFKFMKNSLNIYFQVKILTLEIFTHMLPPPSPPFPSCPCSFRRPWLYSFANI